MKIFLSHTKSDKAVVEPVALRLRAIFGQENVFYDSWSIQPGDGIIQKMNEGMATPNFVFFFVSDASLNSKMVELEWQTALFKSTKGECKIIPVRLTDCRMPALLTQTLYIDMHTYGIEAAVVQIVNIAQGNSTFTPQFGGFSNLSYTLSGNPIDTVIVRILASHFMEPVTSFLILVGNSDGELSWFVDGSSLTKSDFKKDLTLNDGTLVNALFVEPVGIVITPQFPMSVRVSGNQAIQNTPKIDIRGVLHRKSSDRFEAIPRSG